MQPIPEIGDKPGNPTKNLRPYGRRCQLDALLARSYGTPMTFGIRTPRLNGYRLPHCVIAYAFWAYHRFALNLRDVEDLSAERGITVGHETTPAWIVRLGPRIAAWGSRPKQRG